MSLYSWIPVNLAIVISLITALASSMQFTSGGAGGPFDANWTTTLIDPARPTHSIPVGVSYPIAGGPYPVIVFAHGWEGRVRWYDYIYDNMVPQGYVVAVPASEENLAASGTDLARDQRYVLDYLVSQSASNESSPVYGKVSAAGPFFAAGHSMGGEATILAASDYNLNEHFVHEFSAMMLLSACGGTTEKRALAAMTKPAFIMSGTSDCTCNPNSTSVPFYDILNTNAGKNTDDCKFLAIIYHGIHCYFCDFSYDYDPSARDAECVDVFMRPCAEALDQRTQIDLINKYMSLFFNAVVSGKSSDFAAVSTALHSDLQSHAMDRIAANCTL